MIHKNKYLAPKALLGLVYALLLIGGSSMFLILQNANGQGSTPPNTGQVGPIHSLTPTSLPTSTPLPSPTLTDLPTISPTLNSTIIGPLTPTPTATPTALFFDNFSDNSLGWYTSNVAGYTRLFTDKGLRLTDTNQKQLIESLPTTHKFDDFSLTTAFALEQGDMNDSVGIYLRGDSNLDHDYRLDIFGNNTYAISKEYLGISNTPESVYLVPPTLISQAEHIDGLNTVNIVMKGPLLILIINGKIITSLTDTDYTRGQVALFVTNGITSAGVTAIFSDIEINPTPDQLPG